MSVSFRILPSRGLVYVRYEGHVELASSFTAFGEYMHHPDFRPGQKQLVDLSRVTGFERDYTKLFSLQALKAEAFVTGAGQTLVVYYAPSEEAQRMCQLVTRSWADLPSVVALVQQEEAEVLALLGQRESSIAELLEVAA